MNVRSYMTTTVVTANLRDGLRQTFYRMRERNVRHMPVLDEEGRLAGIISDRDLRRPDWVDNEENVAHYYLLDNNAKVADAMTPEPTTVTVETPINDALKIFVSRRYGALPVVDEARRVVGMLSVYDVLGAWLETTK